MTYAALIYSSVYVPGDERSRTRPGHGYPEHSVETIDLREFPSQQALEGWLVNQQRCYPNQKMRLIRYEELTLTTTVTVTVAPK